MTLLDLEHIDVRYRNRHVVRDVSLTVQPGECVGLVGPNGAGKSSLLRAALGLVAFTGQSSLARLPIRDRARAVAFLPQTREIAWPVTVETIVSLGQEARGERLSGAEAVEEAMHRMEVTQFRDRRADRLSGGELARVLIARALAQDTPLLIADEPTAGLDPAHQIAAMETFAGLARDGRAVVVSLHDLGLAARWVTRIVMLNDGEVVADGRPEEVLTRGRLSAIYGIEAHIAETASGLVIQPTERICDRRS